MGYPSSFLYWWEKLTKIYSDDRTYICLIILHNNSFFLKLIFGVTFGLVLVNDWKFCANRCFKVLHHN